MANSSAHRLLRADHHLSQTSGGGGGQTTPTCSSVGGSASTATLLHQHHQASLAKRPNDSVASKQHFRGHQRRQSVARLLPDISKLRLLSWLIEASSELINCDVAIMDGVYAKLNRSQESLLFWNQASSSNSNSSPANKRPAVPLVQPVANNLVISQRQNEQRRQRSTRNHHSLPLTNYDASSLAAVSLSPSLACSSRAADSHSLQQVISSSVSENNNNNNNKTADKANRVCSTVELTGADCDSQNQNQDDFCDSQSDDDDSSSAASSTTSSGIHGGGTSLSSSSSTPNSTSSNSSSSASSTSSTAGDLQRANEVELGAKIYLSSAEQLSEKIRRTVIEHNYLQSLLVNIIRQHDRQRDLLNQQRRRQASLDQFSLNQTRSQQQRIDLAQIANALDDGCLCLCHSQKERLHEACETSAKQARASTLPANSSSSSRQQEQQQISGNSIVAGNNQVPSRKVRRLKKIRANSSTDRSNELNRKDLINLLADKLCENCFETHYWLHSCSAELMQPSGQQKSTNSNSSSYNNSNNNNNTNNRLQQESSSLYQDFNGIIAKRNATFIKLVQQEVRSTISKSIELIDLIRKEIKSPESIKQKQLMRCFSTSIQLLTSVGNYVVPAQDISTFIPEVGQQQTTLFCLPSSDFDHLLLYQPTSPNQNQNHQQQQQLSSNYHLASAPDIPIRRRAINQFQQKLLIGQEDSNKFLPVRGNQLQDNKTIKKAEQALSSNLQKLKTSDGSITTGTVAPEASTIAVTSNVAADSSSGASSNNSSASSSIARGTVQQSSLTRDQTSSATLDGKTSHDLSFETIARLSRHQTEDESIFESRPKFWQSSKFNFIKKLLHVKQQRLLRQQSKDRRIYNNKVQNKFRLVMMDLTHFNKSQQLLTTENGVNSLLTSMRNVLEFGLYLTLKLY